MKSEKQKQHLDKLVKFKRDRGYWHSEETVLKISKANKGKVAYNKGIPMTEEQRKKNSDCHKGLKTKEQCYNWKGGSWVWWSAEIKKRDHFTCRKCKLYDPDIVEVCHLIPIRGLKNRNLSGHPLNSYENLITLCPNDHTRLDKGIFTKEDICV